MRAGDVQRRGGGHRAAVMEQDGEVVKESRRAAAPEVGL